MTVTWSAVFKGTSDPAGSFPGGNTGASVLWEAPIFVCDDVASEVTITATATDSGTRGHNESKSDSVDVAIEPVGTWTGIGSIGYCDPDDPDELRWPPDGPLEDSCENEFEIWCVGYFSYQYNGYEFASCIWHNGGNDAEYKLTANGRLHSIRHSTFHRCNNDPQICDPYPQGCDGYYCWKVTYKDCIGGDVTTWWRRSPTLPPEIWQYYGEEDPYGGGTRHP